NGTSTAPVSPPKEPTSVTGTLSAATSRAIQNPWPPACRCTSERSPRCSKVIVNDGAGANTTTPLVSVSVISARSSYPSLPPGYRISAGSRALADRTPGYRKSSSRVCETAQSSSASGRRRTGQGGDRGGREDWGD